MHVAIIGAGYAGMSCAAKLANRDVKVSVFEAAQVPGGRARRIEAHGRVLDNGQHILIGAYTRLLQMMRLVGADPATLLERRPLELIHPGQMALRVPRLPAPLHLAAALLRAKGLDFQEKRAAAGFMHRLKRTGFRLARDCTFDELMIEHRQPEKLVRFLWKPLCVAALNTPAGEASAQVFLNVLRDSLAAGRAASDLLLPRTDFSALFPEPAERFVHAHGGEVRRSTTIHGIDWHPWGFTLGGDASGRSYTHVVAAVAPFQLAPLLTRLPRMQPILDDVAAFRYEPVLTAYLGYPGPVRLPAPMLGVGGLTHFLFQRSPDTLTAVISANGPHRQLSPEKLIEKIQAEIRQIAGIVPPPAWTQIITEKRATFACRPGLHRPGCETPLTNFFLCGDYVDSDYPATLEAAVRSGIACSRLIRQRAAALRPA